MAAERSIELVVGMEPDKIYVLADRQRFKQVLLNLLTNAVKYTPKGGQVTVSAGPGGANKHRVVVSDTGPGIPAEKLSRLFTPFDRLGADQSDVQGTGLGLAVSQRLIHAMNGAVGVDTNVGRGSTFWVELPRTSSPLDRLAKLEDVAGNRIRAPIAGEKQTVLYIEDNLSNLSLVQQILDERPEISLITAMQGSIGLELARRHAPNLILLDLHLPDIPGWDVLAQLRADDKTRSIPTIVISADATRGQIQRLKQAGASAYLTKPLDINEFVEALDQNTNQKYQSTQPADAKS
jgi:CheY-like chemotaxis protein